MTLCSVGDHYLLTQKVALPVHSLSGYHFKVGEYFSLNPHIAEAACEREPLHA